MLYFIHTNARHMSFNFVNMQYEIMYQLLTMCTEQYLYIGIYIYVQVGNFVYEIKPKYLLYFILKYFKLDFKLTTKLLFV